MKYFLLFMLCTLFSNCQTNDKKQDPLNLESKLAGKWKAKAFDGELHEEWILDENGWMQQVGYYIENSDTSYSAKTRIEKIDDDIILFSVIKNSNPKIFKAKSVNNDQIVFENDDYKNPFQVKYEFLPNGKYKRTIKGYEKDSLVIYEFNFEKQD
ncbi:MAG: hypothetical protein O6943_01905 [Bacteroidetes bacterium]|nr:hypothetical protein [Bacteroidota bacterium]